jgi:hypothetical protein
MDIGYCEICHKFGKIVRHHLSYDPEILMDVCHSCHLTLHLVDIEALEKIIELKKKYGHLWTNGNEQYQKSKHYKKIQTAYRKTDKCRMKEKERRQDPEWKAKRQAYLDKNKEGIKQLKHRWYLEFKEKYPEKLKEINRKAGKKYYDKKKIEQVALTMSA